MPRQLTKLLTLSAVISSTLFAQGLTTQASKDDWEEINFEFSSAVLSDGYPSLLRLADLLQKNSGYHVKVEGNTDNIGSERSNEKLGLARANTVRDFLVKYGATAGQIDVSTRGKRDPKYPGYKNGYSKTDVPRWMNRRVVLTVTDQNGKTVSDGGVKQAIEAIAPAPQNPPCCDDILKRLDQITGLLNDMKGQNADLRREVDNLKNQQAGIENKVNNLPKPLNEEQTGHVVDARLEKARDPRFALLGLNIGADDQRNLTFTGSGRFFAPFKEHFAIQAQGEYMYYRNQKEGQFDIGLVNRHGSFQGGLFASFKNVDLTNGVAGNVNGAPQIQGNGTLGQGALVLDYIFSRGKVGLFGSKAFLDNAVLNRANYTFQDANGNMVIAPNVFMENYLHVVDQIGVQGTVGLWGNTYMEANLGYLKSIAHADRPGGTLRFVFPLNNHLAFTVEGGVNETLIGPGNNGRAVVGVEFGNLLRPKEFASVEHPIPMQVPRVRYEIATKRVQVGVSPPIADAGPDQLGIAAGNVTLNGSGSRDPNGEALTYQWIQEGGPTVAISNANQAIASFTAAAGQGYTFRLTVRNTDGQQASARTRVTTNSAPLVNILFFTANPSTINAGQSSTLAWNVQNATTVTISSGVGTVNPSNGSVPVSPTITTTYTLTATNAQGSQTATAIVTVNSVQPQLTVCTAIPMTVNQGESATLYYQTLNATGVSISPTVGVVSPSGSTVVTPAASTVYTVTATGASGSTAATCSISLQVVPGTSPRIVKFSGSPLTIAQGSTSTLLWAVDNADTVTIDQGVGSVDNRTGTTNVTPQQTTLYTLTATNKFGTSTAPVTITVTTVPPVPPAPTISSFTANPTSSPSPGSPVVLTCLAANAASVVISGVGPVDKSGNITVNPTTQTTYVCVATGNNPAQQASANLTVPVGNGGGGGGGGPVINVTSPTATCSATGGTTVICQTIYRLISLDLTGTTSANPPVSFVVTSRQTSAVVLNPTSSTVQVQLSQLFGDYFFDVTATDSMGKVTKATVDVQLVSTSVR